MIAANTWTEDAKPAFDPKRYMPKEALEKLTRFVAEEHALHPGNARRVVSQTIAFLMTCAEHRDLHLIPPLEIKFGRRAFVLHTKEYMELCNKLGGFLPYDPERDEGDDNEEAIKQSVALMKAAGLPVDDELWSPEGSSCYNDYHSSDACTH